MSKQHYIIINITLINLHKDIHFSNKCFSKRRYSHFRVSAFICYIIDQKKCQMTPKIDIILKLYSSLQNLTYNIKSSTPNCLVYGETRRYQLSFVVKIKRIMYWAKVWTAHGCRLNNVIIILLFLWMLQKWVFYTSMNKMRTRHTHTQILWTVLYMGKSNNM